MRPHSTTTVGPERGNVAIAPRRARRGICPASGSHQRSLDLEGPPSRRASNGLARRVVAEIVLATTLVGVSLGGLAGYALLRAAACITEDKTTGVKSRAASSTWPRAEEALR